MPQIRNTIKAFETCVVRALVLHSGKLAALKGYQNKGLPGLLSELDFLTVSSTLRS